MTATWTRMVAMSMEKSGGTQIYFGSRNRVFGVHIKGEAKGRQDEA